MFDDVDGAHSSGAAVADQDLVALADLFEQRVAELERPVDHIDLRQIRSDLFGRERGLRLRDELNGYVFDTHACLLFGPGAPPTMNAAPSSSFYGR